MKNLLILATIFLTYGFAHAQCKVYSTDRDRDYGGQIAGYASGPKIYSTDRDRDYGGQIVGYGTCGQMSTAALAILLLL